MPASLVGQQEGHRGGAAGDSQGLWTATVPSPPKTPILSGYAPSFPFPSVSAGASSLPFPSPSLSLLPPDAALGLINPVAPYPNTLKAETLDTPPFRPARRMHATGSVTWAVGAQASVLGRCNGGGVPYPSSSSSSSAPTGGRVQGLGAVRCCVQTQAQEKKPRVRKTKEERREMVESFVNTIMIRDVQIMDGQFTSATSANQMDVYTSDISAETVSSAESIDRQDVVEQPLLDASPNAQAKSEDLASQPALDAKGLLQTEDQHNRVEKDESGFKKSISGITSEEREGSNAKHEHAISTTTTISRRTGKGLHKKEDNLFWLIIRAFVVSMSKLWAK
uniref:Uncharacterized protein n=1 Tax=Avena sativa TaxID=4498 RepID=A0ACD5YJ92_AVESA